MKSHNFDEPSMSASGEAAAIQDTDGEFRRDLLDLIPFLRAFSRSLCGDRELAGRLAPAPDERALTWRKGPRTPGVGV